MGWRNEIVESGGEHEERVEDGFTKYVGSGPKA